MVITINTIRFFQYLVFGLILICSATSVHAQIKQSEVALCNYSFSVDKSLRYSLIEDDFKSHKDIKKVNQESIAIIKNSYDSSISKIDHRTILKFLPVDTFHDTLPYSDFGFPEATIKQASKVSDHKLYASLDVKIVAKNTRQAVFQKYLPDTESRGNYLQKVITTFPQVSVTLTLGNAEGEKIGFYTGEFSSPDSIIIETKFISLPKDNGYWNANREFFNPQKIKYHQMLDYAIAELIAKMEDYTYY